MIDDICVDASLIVSLLIPERYSNPATRLWETWIKKDHRIIAPSLLGYEVTSAIYRKVYRGLIASEDGQAALAHFLDLNIELVYNPDLHLAASLLARQFNRPNPYDAHYLALSNYRNCQLWTADEKFYNTVKGNVISIKWVENAIE
jgi:predicted nucleic acid-binding protein